MSNIGCYTEIISSHFTTSGNILLSFAIMFLFDLEEKQIEDFGVTPNIWWKHVDKQIARIAEISSRKLISFRLTMQFTSDCS